MVSRVAAHVRDPDFGERVYRAALMPPALVNNHQIRQDTVITSDCDLEAAGR